jgi:hypothetical protein
MESDIDNSKASGILNDLHANDRCVGVLTKPDRLSNGERGDIWKKVLQGHAFVKGHGYYVVRQPSQAEITRGMSHAEARIQEQDYFESESWNNRFFGFEERLGTRRLQVALADKLAALILGRFVELTPYSDYLTNNFLACPVSPRKSKLLSMQSKRT